MVEYTKTKINSIINDLGLHDLCNCSERELIKFYKEIVKREVSNK